MNKINLESKFNNLPFLIPKHRLYFCCSRTLAQSEGTSSGVTAEQDPPSFSGSLSSTRTQLDLLEQLTSTGSSADANPCHSFQLSNSQTIKDGSSGKLTIRDQLAQLVGDRHDDFIIPLGKKTLKKASANFLTVSQKRNIRRQAYLIEVSQRNDSVFLATIGAFTILPPTLILRNCHNN
ncbi:hypothetical protein SADUNF_Sadunf05G0149400 [Salix dunnii]|uniref:Uncharacterized protein n=1 Tax=Salix dunnii TaxID=1413687 RepID=A0A835MZJ9_9ROSI|nr:hypothetical protein SADUNF_Sadunf05G0149400 [Salix dunnii]